MPRSVKRKLANGQIKTYTYGPRRKGPPTVGEVVTSYLQSAGYQRMKPATRALYRHCLEIIRRAQGDVAIPDIRRAQILDMQDELADRPAMANKVLKLWKVLINHALDREYIVHSPLSRPVKYLPEGEHRRWTEGEIEYALKNLPNWATRPMILALYTGQRLGDCLAMRWADFDGSGINVVQEKTGARVWIPAHKALKAHLAAWRKEAKGLTILTKQSGAQIVRKGFSTMFSHLTDRHVVLEGLTFHGLRKSAAARLAEAGCTTHEIAAITGHKNLSMVQHYTAEADQKTGARAAILKLERKTDGKSEASDGADAVDALGLSIFQAGK
jgi:integrase